MNENTASQAKHPIQVVSRRTGLSSDVIRVWERRYGAVNPTRSGNRRRLYTDEDVERLLLLRRATLAGRRIGDVARLPLGELEALVADDDSAREAAPVPKSSSRPDPSARSHFRACIEAVERLDAASLQAALTLAGADLSTPVLLEGVLLPLMETIGERWHVGSINVYQEHMASAVVRSALESLRLSHNRPFASPNIVLGTLSGHRHEIGALMAAVVAASEGWNVTYLGPDLPPEEIAAAAARRGAGVVGVSLVYAEDQDGTVAQLRKIRTLLPRGVAMLVGGRAAGELTASLGEPGVVHTPDLPALRRELAALKDQASAIGRG